eukprot:m.90502 g.90502  ORF g.90502 m.90502 type:complete len:480 (+) comp15264_c0_seq1:219-1658(+)
MEVVRAIERLDVGSSESEILAAVSAVDLQAAATAQPRISEDEHARASALLKWAKAHPTLAVRATEIPAGILPQGVHGRLLDIKVHPKKRQTDDDIYKRDDEIRARVARGNCLLQLDTVGKANTCCLLQSLKKFTGGLGDDDDVTDQALQHGGEAQASAAGANDAGEMKEWMRFFTEPFAAAEQIVAMDKANGEAAHLSARWVEGVLLLCIGSKNVHIAVRAAADIALYERDATYRVACLIARAVFASLDRMPEPQRTRLLYFLAATHLTATFEFLQVEHMHVELLTKEELLFIAWTPTDLLDTSRLTMFNPAVGLNVARTLGLSTVRHTLLPIADLDKRIQQTRSQNFREGDVLYFLNARQSVIGLMKIKAVWYVYLRACREKLRAFVQRASNSSGSSLEPELASYKKAMDRRFREIQKWLGVTDTVRQAWLDLALAFGDWAAAQVQAGTLVPEHVANVFPTVWQRFLKETGATDDISV